MIQVPKPLVAGNWKMNGMTGSLDEIGRLQALAAGRLGDVDVWVCPPATLIAAAAGLARGTGLAIGAQDCHAKPSGAHTGDISAAMLKDAGAIAVIVGHSERRADHGETDAAVAAKAAAVQAAGLTAIICVGETEAERDAGQALAVVGRQIAGSLPPQTLPERLVVAYEPVWAIGTGRTPGPDDVTQMHGHIRALLAERLGAGAGAGVRILYGGSVKPDNAALLLGLANVDGALVGGASLKAADFAQIVAAAPAR